MTCTSLGDVHLSNVLLSLKDVHKFPDVGMTSSNIRFRPNKTNILRSCVTTGRKSWERIPGLGLYLKFRGQNLGYLSPMFLEAKIWGSDTNFRGKFWGQAPLTS